MQDHRIAAPLSTVVGGGIDIWNAVSPKDLHMQLSQAAVLNVVAERQLEHAGVDSAQQKAVNFVDHEQRG
ncbi:hypothetical protein D3C76_610910 [compost metagenome]